MSEASAILSALGLPAAQTKERSALTFLAPLNLRPATPWRDAEAPLLGITQMMDFIAEH